MPSVPRRDTPEPEFLEIEIPKRTVRLSVATKALVEMEVDKKNAAFFPKPKDVTLKVFSARVGSWITAARRHVPGSIYVRRIMTFSGDEDGVAVWRTK